jgi:hypothetical protein
MTNEIESEIRHRRHFFFSNKFFGEDALSRKPLKFRLLGKRLRLRLNLQVGLPAL